MRQIEEEKGGNAALERATIAWIRGLLEAGATIRATVLGGPVLVLDPKTGAIHGGLTIEWPKDGKSRDWLGIAAQTWRP